MFFNQNQVELTDRHGTFRMGKRVGMALVLVAGLAACAVSPKNPMTAAQIKALDIDVIDVAVFPGTPIFWGAGEEAYANSKGCEKPEPDSGNAQNDYAAAGAENKPQNCDYDALISSPESHIFMESRVVEMMEATLAQQVQPAFQGNAPSRLEVRIFEVRIISGGQSVFIGGAHVLRATLNVVDLGTGRSIAQNQELFSQAGYAPGGLLSLIIEAASADPVERLSVGYANGAREWLSGGR